MNGLRRGHLTAGRVGGIDRGSSHGAAIPALRTLIRSAETLLIAALGAVVFTLIGVPAGPVSGSMIVTAAAALLGRPMQVPLPLAWVCFVLIGILLGAVVTPETLKGMATWPLSIMLLMVTAAVMIVATTAYLRLVHGWDPLSALLGASPGSMAQALALSAELNANIRGVAIVQTMRVLLVTIGLPGGLALFGLVAGGIPRAPAEAGASLGELALLAAASTATAVIVHWLRFPGGLLFGAMAASAVLHGADIVHATLPWWLGGSAVVVLGAMVGSRFSNATLPMLMKYLWAALGSAAVAIAVSALFALVVISILPLRPSDVVIAFAPGAQDTMMVLALALHLDPVFVGAHHLTRFLIVTFSVAVAARSLARRGGVPKRGEKRRPPGAWED